MPGFEHGFNRAIGFFLSGILIWITLKIFSIDEHPASILIAALGLASIVSFMIRMRYWSTNYILGFLIGYLSLDRMFGFDISVPMPLLFAVYLILRRRVFKQY